MREHCYYCFKPVTHRRQDTGVKVCEDHGLRRDTPVAPAPTFKLPSTETYAGASLDRLAELCGTRRLPGETDNMFRLRLRQYIGYN